MSCPHGNWPPCDTCDEIDRITAERDAEIEALRAEVAAVWNAMPSGTRYLDPPDGGDVPLHEQVRRMAADAVRAERLAEAGCRVTAAFRALGEATAWTRAAEQARHECEAAMLALDAALRDLNQEGK